MCLWSSTIMRPFYPALYMLCGMVMTMWTYLFPFFFFWWRSFFFRFVFLNVSVLMFYFLLILDGIPIFCWWVNHLRYYYHSFLNICFHGSILNHKRISDAIGSQPYEINIMKKENRNKETRTADSVATTWAMFQVCVRERTDELIQVHRTPKCLYNHAR